MLDTSPRKAVEQSIRQEPEADIRHPQRSRLTKLAVGASYLLIWSTMVVALAHFALRQPWIRPLLRDIRPWLPKPEISGGWQPPYNWLLVAGVLVGVMAIGWLASTLALD